jgi:transposase InsO family protein
MASSNSSTGYGPRAHGKLHFDGDEAKYELWEIKFLAHLRLRKLHKEITAEAAPTEEANIEKNAEAFAEMVQYLDDRSLSLIIREAQDDGRKALQILREHYIGKGKPRVISLYQELTSMKLDDTCITDYIIHAETAANALKAAGETISDALLVAMALKGLSEEYKTFVTVITQRDKAMTFAEFKVALRNFEETEKSIRNKPVDTVMGMKPRFNGKCFECGTPGHMAVDCRKKQNKPRRWCEKCKSPTHDTVKCRKNTAKSATVDTKENKSEDHQYAFTFVDNVSNVFTKGENLLVDCGATAHIVSDKAKFTSFDKSFNAENHFIELADGSKTNGVVLGKGNACVKLYDVNGNSHNVVLENALYVPSFKQNIFSVQAAAENGASMLFTGNHSELQTHDGTIFDIKKHGRLYYLNNTIPSNVSTRTSEDWHRTFGHCNMRDVLNLENVVEGMTIKKRDFDCSTCTLGKMPEFRNREADERASTVLELVHCDLAGPIDPVAKDGFRYAISFVDDYSGINMIYFLKRKSDTVQATEKFIADSSPYGTIKRLRTDNGTEFTCANFKSLLIKNKIKHEKSAPYSAHQNGTVERVWRSIFDMARCLLLESNVPKTFWTYAVMTSVHIRNRCYNKRLGKTPYEAFTGRKPNVSNMHVFGTVCFSHVQNPKKLDARSEQAIFVGYDRESPAFLVYYRETGKVRKVRCVKFTDKYENPERNNSDADEWVTEYDHIEKEEDNTPHVADDDKVPTDDVEEQKHESENDHEERRYPLRERRKPQRYPVDCVIEEGVDYCFKVADVPITYTDAMRSVESDKWQQAMQEEIDALAENDTFEYVTIPDDRKIVGGRWVYNVKIGQNNEERYKARYVAKGYSQVADIDYQETFSPTARITSVRMLLQVAVQEDMIVHQMDVKTAYLNAPIDCEIFMEQPEGFVKKGENGEKLVCKLNRSLYGLKQSGRNWNKLLHEHLETNRFEQSYVDNCVYTRDGGNVIVIIWVDDIMIAAKDESLLQEVKDMFKQRFKMKDLGPLSWFLGIEFERKESCFEMNQKKYLEKLLQKFDMKDCKPRATPCDIGVNKMKSEDSKELTDPELYRSMVGSLIYAMTSTRPDICYVVTLLSQYMSKPTNAHLNMAKNVLRYIKGTLNFCLRFMKLEGQMELSGCSDSDWGGSEDRRSITGYCFQLNVNGMHVNGQGPLISWKSRKQQTVALSTCEAEYMALAAAIQEGKFLRQLLADMQGCNVKRVNIHVDNQGAISLAKNPVYHQRSKHIDIRYHFIRSEVQEGSVTLHYVPSEKNMADLFTKPVSKVRLNLFF